MATLIGITPGGGSTTGGTSGPTGDPSQYAKKEDFDVSNPSSYLSGWATKNYVGTQDSQVRSSVNNTIVSYLKDQFQIGAGLLSANFQKVGYDLDSNPTVTLQTDSPMIAKGVNTSRSSGELTFTPSRGGEWVMHFGIGFGATLKSSFSNLRQDNFFVKIRDTSAGSDKISVPAKQDRFFEPSRDDGSNGQMNFTVVVKLTKGNNHTIQVETNSLFGLGLNDGYVTLQRIPNNADVPTDLSI